MTETATKPIANFSISLNEQISMILKEIGAPKREDIDDIRSPLIRFSQITFNDLKKFLLKIGQDQKALETFWSMQDTLRVVLTLYYYKVAPQTIKMLLRSLNRSGLNNINLIHSSLQSNDSFEKHLSESLLEAPVFTDNFARLSRVVLNNSDCRDTGYFEADSTRKSCDDILLTAFYLMRVSYSEKMIEDIVNKLVGMSEKVQCLKIIEVAEKLEDFKDYPFDWAFELAYE